MFSVCFFVVLWFCQTTAADKTLVGMESLHYVAPRSDIIVNFNPPFTQLPVVDAWARGLCGERYLANVIEIWNDKFTVSVDRKNGGSGSFHEHTKLFWSASEIVAGRTALLGESEVSETETIPSSNPFTAPTFNHSGHTVDIFGRDIHTSQLQQLLDKEGVTTQKFVDWNLVALNNNIIIRTDSFFIDDSVSVFHGLSNVKILARRIISNGGIFNVKSPKKCQSASSTTCQLPEATADKNGNNGKNGFSSTSAQIYCYQVQGNINITVEASEGSPGGNGGDGSNGNKGANGATKTCPSKCSVGNNRYKGNAGKDGGKGRNGCVGGNPGEGGSVSKLSLVTQHLFGFVNLNQIPGAPAPSSIHGYAGVGGDGGEGSCGKRCKGVVYDCKEKGTDCGLRGPSGNQGQCGVDGYGPNTLPVAAAEGEVAEANLETVESVRTHFEKDLELLNLVRRKGEMCFQRGLTEEAAEIFDFVLDVTDEQSEMHNEVAVLLEYINEGFDYYGNTEIYAPDKDWLYLKDRTDDLLAVGEELETSFNAVLENIYVIEETSSLVQSVVTLSAATNIDMLKFEQKELRSQNKLYVEALKKLDVAMGKQMVEIFKLLGSVLKEYIKEKIAGVLDLLGGIVGSAVGLLTGNPKQATAGASAIIDILRKEKCEGPTIKDIAGSLADNLRFAFEYEVMPASDLDFGAMDASAVPVIMQSSLSKNRNALMTDLRCLFETTDDGPTLERVMNDYFNDGSYRIEVMDMIINIDIRLKQIEYNIQVYEESVTTVDNAVVAAQTSVEIQGMYSFTDVLLNIYQQQENLIMASIYEKSKAYQFESLIEYDVLHLYSNVFSDQATISILGSLEGMVQLQLIDQKLDSQRDVFLNHVASSAGPTSHVFTSHVGFDIESHPDIFASLLETGQTSINIPLVANDPSLTGCESCYNARLVGLYIEVLSENQLSSVPARIFVKVSHQGNNHFLKPLESGGDVVTLLQQTPEDEDSGKIMSFDSDNLVSSVVDPKLQFKFGQDEFKFCDSDVGNFFGSKPCKSPFANYVITVPRNENYKCTTNPNDFISGTNCQDLDFTKLIAINVYLKITSWSNYPTDEDIAVSYRKRLLGNQ